MKIKKSFFHISRLVLAPALLMTALNVHAAKMMEVSPAERADMMKSMRVWRDAGPISAKDLLHGPSQKYTVNQAINECKFYDTYYTEVEDTGKTQKFWCTPPGGDPLKDNIKVKYGQDNGEVFGEVVSSRLAWALGFFADKALPISVTCENCPEDPWKYLNYLAVYQGQNSSISPGGSDAKNEAALYILDSRAKRQKLSDESMRTTGKPYSKSFPVALSEQKYDGTAITIPGDTKAGVGLDEVSLIDRAQGSTQAEIDAMRLFVAFIKHGDNKAANQRLVCPPESVIKKADGTSSCSEPHLVLQDIGSTIGNGALTILGISFGPTQRSKFSYNGWKDTPVWKDISKCQAKLGDNLIGGTLGDPVVSEAGRQFLADLLMQLTDGQITDMFTAARAEQRQGEAAASVQQWVELFKSKRAEVVNAHCAQ